jgi:hypothetical protein
MGIMATADTITLRKAKLMMWAACMAQQAHDRWAGGALVM